MSIPYIPLYVTDYEADTAHLTLEEDGAYMRLLRLCWRTPGCSIPDDPEWIKRRLRVDDATYERSVAPVIEEFFSRAKARLSQPRLQREWERINETSQKRREAGKKGGRPSKSLKTAEKSESRAKAGPKQNESIYNQNQNQNHIDTNVSKKRAPKKQEKAHRLSDDWQIPEDWIDEAVSRGLTRARAYAEAERMRNWSQSSPNGAKVKWLAVWRNWIADKADQPAKPAQPADRHIAAAASRRSAWLDVIDEIEGRGDGGDSWQPASSSSPARLSGPRGGYDGSG